MVSDTIRSFVIFAIIVLTIMVNYQPAYSQVEHNYPVEPQSTDCDKLDLSSGPFKDVIARIENSSFRFTQRFKISRSYGIMNARYYSCDGETGFLILRIDKEDVLFLNVPKSVWNSLITSPDINAYYAAEIRDIFDMKPEE